MKAERMLDSPGSEKAVDKGCKCPVIDNHYGKGTPQGFWINENCPLHGREATNAESAKKEMGE